MDSPKESNSFTKIVSNYGSDIRNLSLTLIGVFVIVLGIIIITNFNQTINDVQCFIPKHPLEILMGISGMIGLSLIGVPFLPATVFGLGVWLVLKVWACS